MMWLEFSFAYAAGIVLFVNEARIGTLTAVNRWMLWAAILLWPIIGCAIILNLMRGKARP